MDLSAVHAAIAALEPELGALVELVDPGNPPDGPLTGITVAVKELIAVEGSVTTAGSDVLPFGPDPAAADASCVASLRAAGAAIVARARTHEMAWGITTFEDGRRVHNPATPALIAGGSTGGPAAMVAAGVVDLGLGTDTAGSIRIPAWCCGLVGWKPEHGAVPLDGVLPLGPSFDAIGVVGRDLDLVLEALDALGGIEPAASGAGDDQSPAGLRIGIVEDASWPGVDGSLGAAARQAVAALEAAGASGAPVDLPPASEVMAAFSVVRSFEAVRVHRDLGLWPSERSSYGPVVRARLDEADEIDDAVADAARTQLRSLRDDAEAAMEGFDVIVSPIAAAGPPTTGDPDTVRGEHGPMAWRDAVIPFTVVANAFGLASVSVPVGVAGGRPVSVLLTAARGRGRALARAASAVTPRRPGSHR